MSTLGKLEGRVTIPTAGRDVDVVETGGNTFTATIPAGDYYLSSADSEANDLIAEIEAQLEDGSAGGDYTVSIAAGEAGTGKVTITHDGGGSISAVALTWTDSDLRDLLGFATDGDLAGALTYTSAEQARMLWISDSAWQSYNHAGNGREEAQQVAQESPDGASQFVAVYGRRSFNDLSLLAVKRARMFVQFEATVGESLQRFWRDAILCESAHAKTVGGGPIRWYPDADDDATFRTWKLRQDARDFRPEMIAPPLTTLWQIAFEAVEQ